MLFQATSKLEWLECGEKSRSFTKSRDSFRFRCLTARGKANKTFVQMMEALGYDIELTYVKREG